ncbi:hypothetical protein GW17_00022003 [Ensete ventricosum]|nr:hypothetical protein GW17_00022003 [Ensete ventricosum]RZR90608.1 hypothetical protein BHM03_00018533 [Ensete ventricosum]
MEVGGCAAAAERPKASEEGNDNAEPAVPHEKKMNGISAVIPGWFSELSPMWPGIILVFRCVCRRSTLLSVSTRVSFYG